MSQKVLHEKINSLTSRWSQGSITTFQAGKELFMMRVAHSSAADRTTIDENQTLLDIWKQHIGWTDLKNSPKRNRVDADIHQPHSNSPYAFPGRVRPTKAFKDVQVCSTSPNSTPSWHLSMVDTSASKKKLEFEEEELVEARNNAKSIDLGKEGIKEEQRQETEEAKEEEEKQQEQGEFKKEEKKKSEPLPPFLDRDATPSPLLAHHLVNPRASISANYGSKEELITEFKELMKEMKLLYEDQQVDAAFSKLELTKQYLRKVPYSFKKLKEELEAELEQFPERTLIEEDQHEMQRVLDALDDTEGFKDVRKKKYMMQIRKEKDKTLTIRFSAHMDEMKIFNLLTLFYETDLYPLWFPHSKYTKLVHKYHKAKKMVFTRIGMPGLMSDRENVMIGMGVNRLNINGCIYVISRSCHNLKQKQGVPVPKLDKGKVPLDVNQFGFEIKPIGINGVEIRSVFNFNPHVKYVPQWLINFANKHFAKQMFEKMMKFSKSFKGTKFEGRDNDKNNQDFYDWIRKQLDDYFHKQGWV